MTVAVLLAEPPDDPDAELRRDVAEVRLHLERLQEIVRLECLLNP